MLQFNDRFHSINLDHKRSLQRLSEKASSHLEDVLKPLVWTAMFAFFKNFGYFSDFSQVFENKDVWSRNASRESAAWLESVCQEFGKNKTNKKKKDQVNLWAELWGGAGTNGSCTDAPALLPPPHPNHRGTWASSGILRCRNCGSKRAGL